MRRRYFLMVSGLAAIVAVAGLNAGCGILGPSCTDERGAVFNRNDQVAAGAMNTYVVASTRHSNLVMRLTWTDPGATLALRATIIDCGEHIGCSMGTITPPFGPGGSSPTPQPWPPGLREMQADGTRGKTYRVEVTGDASRDASFTLDVTYRIDCER